MHVWCGPAEHPWDGANRFAEHPWDGANRFAERESLG